MSSLVRLGVLVASAAAVSVLLRYTRVETVTATAAVVVVPPPVEGKKEVPPPPQEPSPPSKPEEEEPVVVATQDVAELANQLVDEAIQSALNSLPAPPQESFSKSFTLMNSAANEEDEQVLVDFVLLEMDAMWFVWCGERTTASASSPNLSSLVVAINNNVSHAFGGAGGASLGSQNDLGSAARIAKKTQQVIHLSSSLYHGGVVDEEQHPELRMLVEREIVQRILERKRMKE